MAELGFTFDANTVSPQTEYEPLPAGEYVMQVIDSEWKDTKAGTGKYLELTMEIMDGDYVGRRYFDRLNLDNANVTAVEIAQKTLSSLCHATDQMVVTRSDQLHFIPFIAKMRTVPRRDDRTRWENKATYVPLHGAETQQKAPAPAQQPSTARSTFNGGSAASRPATQPQQRAAAPAPAVGGAKPWEKHRRTA